MLLILMILSINKKWERVMFWVVFLGIVLLIIFVLGFYVGKLLFMLK